ncbi:hypothetical protein K1719_046348 [Acacia pycnantha]|nr:hypothetical protein K1719_046348 [Acacia pycnantha]
MAVAFIWSLQDRWPFSLLKNDDLRASNQLLLMLSVLSKRLNRMLCFHGHLVAAKKSAEEVGSSFLVLESPLGKCSWGSPSGEVDASNHFQSFVSSLVPQKGASMASLTLKRFSLSNDVRPQLVKPLSFYMDSQLLGQSPSVSGGDSTEIRPRGDYEAPAFAKSIYPLLEDLHNIFVDLPSIGIALAHVQKMLLDINRGEVLDTRIISEVYRFRVAVEGLRVALNSKGLQPISRKDISTTANTEFSELPVEEKSYALFANALRSQTNKYKTIVALVDASGLAGLRKHWNTPLPHEVKEFVGQLVTNCEVEKCDSNQTNRRRLLTEKPMVAVGAGATAVLSASSLSKAVPASTLMKVVTLKVPTSLKFLISHTQRALAFGLGPSKAVVPGIASSGVKTSSALKATLSAEKIRAVAHSVIASAEKTSMSAMRTAFYEIMRKRKIQPVGFVPWATFVGSVGTCTGLLLYGDGIECAVESAPAAPSIASLGRGIEHLHKVSEVAMQTEGTRIQKSIESLINRFKKAKA